MEIWDSILGGAAAARCGDQRDVGAPLGFSTRVVAKWREMNRDEKFRFWRRWSLASSILTAGAACILTVVPVSPPHAGAGLSELRQARAADVRPAPPLLDIPQLSVPLP